MPQCMVSCEQASLSFRCQFPHQSGGSASGREGAEQAVFSARESTWVEVGGRLSRGSELSCSQALSRGAEGASGLRV